MHALFSSFPSLLQNSIDMPKSCSDLFFNSSMGNFAYSEKTYFNTPLQFPTISSFTLNDEIGSSLQDS